MSEFKRIAVIGAGTMGSGIAAQIANAGHKVLLMDLPRDDDPLGVFVSTKTASPFEFTASTATIRLIYCDGEPTATRIAIPVAYIACVSTTGETNPVPLKLY